MGGDTAGESQERKELGKREKGKEGGKWFEGKERLFAFCVTVSFTPSFPPISIHHATTLLLTLSPTPHSHTTPSFTHQTPHKHAWVLSSFFLCV